MRRTFGEKKGIGEFRAASGSRTGAEWRIFQLKKKGKPSGYPRNSRLEEITLGMTTGLLICLVRSAPYKHALF